MTMCVLVFICLLPTVFLSVGSLARAQQPKAYRVGAIHQGGPYYTVIDGLRDRLRELGLKEGKHFILEIRDAKGDLKSVEKAAIDFEREKTGLLYSVTSSVTLAAKRVTTEIPIVFCVGSDPVALGLVESFAKPG